MSTVRTNRIELADGTEGVDSSYVIDGSAKAWINFNGTGTIAVRDSLNISSIVDNGVGDYTVNNTNSFANILYNSVGSCNLDHIGNANRIVSLPCSQAPTASSIRMNTYTAHSAAIVDMQYISINCQGDLA